MESLILWGLKVIGAMLVLGVVLKKVIGIPCSFCTNMRLTAFKKLPQSTQQTLLAYFQYREKRMPDTAGIYVCQECRLVYDDFSGEKRSRDIDDQLRGGKRTFCKVCNRLILGCDPDREEIQCRCCETVFRWEEYGEEQWRILMPPEGAPVLKRCRDTVGVG